MRDKFSIPFDEVDRAATESLRRQLGLDANPWRTHQRIVTSYDYLKQPDVFEQFRSASTTTVDSPHLPWDLLIVDEAHNLAPAPYGAESDASQLLGQLAPLFEHKLFLTATPHNGHTRSFSGLLERLDPVRFTRKSDKLGPAEKARVEEVVVRRLKREINERTKPNTRFSDRKLRAVPLYLHKEELALATAFEEFRTRVRSLVVQRKRGEQLAGAFAVEVLGKRLLSCPATFADSWWRYREGMKQATVADAAEVQAAEASIHQDLADDRETESRTALATHTVGAWLRPMAEDLADEIRLVDRSLSALDLRGEGVGADPSADARFEALTQWVDDHLRVDGKWKPDERLVIFTEYKTTLDYLQRRLTACFPESDAIQILFGNMDPPTLRDDIKAAFNDPTSGVRILVATDAASEGLNLQETARYLLHYDVPWNPSRLEQRNGRLDRHGQARDVFVYHFASDEAADLRFLAHVVRKVDSIRDDLGSVGDVFDSAFQRRFIEAADEGDVRGALDRAIDEAKGRADVPRDSKTGIATDTDTGEDELARLRALGDELDLSPETLRPTLDLALRIGSALSHALEGPDQEGRYRIKPQLTADWQAIIDETVRLLERSGMRGALPAIVFDPKFYMDTRNGRPVFRPRRDTALLHLGHPLFQRALASFARARFAGGGSGASRFTVTRGSVPTESDGLVLLTVEELAVNELRETFHHWVRTLRFPVRDGQLGSPLPHVAASALDTDASLGRQADLQEARELWTEVSRDVREQIRRLGTDLEERLKATLSSELTAARQREEERFRSRQGELSTLIEASTLARLEREIQELDDECRKGRLFDEHEILADLMASQRQKEEELKRRRDHYETLREQLASERKRVLERLLPLRFALRGRVQVFPVALEIRLPDAGQRH